MPSTEPDSFSQAKRTARSGEWPGRASDGTAEGATVEVAVGLVRSPSGQVLVQRRPEYLQQAGLWEFPGGKLEPGESASLALQRELGEELGIDVLPGASLIDIAWDYRPDGERMLIHAIEVSHWTGEPQPREGQEIVWAEVAELNRFSWPAANRPILRALQLPELYLITPTEPQNPTAWLDRVTASFADSGVRLVQMRRHDLDDEAYMDLAQALYRRCREHGVLMLINRDLHIAQQLEADGLHLPAQRLSRLEGPMERYGWVGVSCHSAQCLSLAAAREADFAVLSPVRWTPSHPDRQPMGWGVFQELAVQAQLPVYALGGVGPEDVYTARGHGGQGVAAIRGLLADT